MFGTFRLALAFNVVAYHILGLPSIGPFAVYTFFILSGFLMTTIMQNTYGYRWSGLQKYALNRFLRLYPIYWVLVIFTIVIVNYVGQDFAQEFHKKMQLPNDIVAVIANLTMIYPDFNPVNFPTRLAPATWALTIELFFYFFIGIGISRNKYLTIVWFSVSVIYILFDNINSSSVRIGYGSILTGSLPFSMGAMIYYFKEEIRRITSNHISLITAMYITNLVFTCASGLLLPEQHWKINLLGTYLNLILSGCVIVILYYDGIKAIPKHIDQKMGDLSYPVYVFHFSGACLAVWLLPGEPTRGLGVEGAAVFLVGSLITIFVSLVVNKHVNVQIEKIRNKIRANSKSNVVNQNKVIV
ncbi:MAG: acyltransferase family protein [Pseudomonadales bacterium]